MNPIGVLQMIPIKKIHPHPDNPRKELGELTELAESIKAWGIMQNLTIVPDKSGFCPSCEYFIPSSAGCAENYEGRPPCPKWKWGGNYTVIIGHRRLAAAKLARLTEVPCIISDIDQKEQIATMLLENMQRSDLTAYEQAQGFQMMLNFGETMESIAEKTGFSQQTVKHRIKLLEFDQAKLKQAAGKQITLGALEEIGKIEDAKERNKVLDAYGSDNYKWALGSAINEQNAKKNLPLIRKELKCFATQIEEPNTHKYEYVSHLCFSRWKEGDYIPKDAGGTKYYFYLDARCGTGTLYKQKEKQKADRRPQKEIDREKAVHEREAQLQELTEKAFMMRRDFIMSLSPRKEQMPDILDHICKAELYAAANYCGFNAAGFREAFGIDDESRYIPEIVTKYHEAYDKWPLRAAVICAWCVLDDKKDNGYWSKNHGGQKMPEYKKNVKLDLTYQYLIRMGYTFSDEERALAAGSHELFREAGK
jgi:ParB family chromosome partitioning protein